MTTEELKEQLTGFIKEKKIMFCKNLLERISIPFVFFLLIDFRS